jgi:hypothetical protein
LGDEVAEFITRKSQISSDTQTVRDIISEPLLKDVNRFLEGIKAITGGAKDFSESNKTYVQAIVTAIVRAITPAGSGFGAPPIPDLNEFEDIHLNPLRYWDYELKMPTLPAPFLETDQQPAGFVAPPPFTNLNVGLDV